MSTKIKNNRLVWFSVFNFLIYTSVFLGRILRDALLFTAPGGDFWFPVVLVCNAFLMTWFSSQLEGWLDKWGTKRVIAFAFLGAAFWFCAMGFGLQQGAPTPLIALFYLGSELPIFLGMNLIWILANDYFTDQQGQKDFPRISAVGQLGIAVASGFVIIQGYLPTAFSTPELILGLAGLNVVLYFVAMALIKHLKPLFDSTADDFVTVDVDNGSQLGFWAQSSADFKWAKGIRFLWLFTLVTVCNFVLLAFFDQTLANGAITLKVTDVELSLMLAKWTFAFGIGAALFQWVLFPRLLDKLGVAKINLSAPAFMLLGAVSYLIFAGDFFAPIWERFNSNFAADHLLEILLFARVCGWVAEFLFNQTLLPLVYGILPNNMISRGRFFVEGPVTAVTNGAAGLFLLMYFTLFESTKDQYGYKLDLMFVLALVTAIFMLYWSVQMIPEFKKVLLERLRQGDDVDLKQYEAEFGAIEGGAWAQLELTQLRSAQSITWLVESHGDKASGRLVETINAPVVDEVKAAAIRGLIAINALAEFNQAWAVLIDSQTPPNPIIIDAMAEAAHHFGVVPSLLRCFEHWLAMECSEQTLSKLLEHIGKSGVDGALAISKFIDEWELQNASQVSATKVLLQLGSGKYYPRLRERLRDSDSLDRTMEWQKLAQTNFADHADALDAFAFLIVLCDEPYSEAGAAIEQLLKRYPWLVWSLLYLLELDFAQLPARLGAVRFIWPLIIHNAIDGEISKSNINLFNAVKGHISAACAPEFMAVDWSDSDAIINDRLANLLTESKSTLTLADYFSDWLVRKSQQNWEIGLAQNYAVALYQSNPSDNLELLKPIVALAHDNVVQVGALSCLFQHHHAIAEQWLVRRHKQWLNIYVVLLGCVHSESRTVFEPITVSADLMSTDVVARDNAMSLIQQGIPRDVFVQFRNELNAVQQRLTGGQGAIPGLAVEWPQKTDPKSAPALWTKVIPTLNDELLLQLMGVEKLNG